jgi:hypothetical protein
VYRVSTLMAVVDKLRLEIDLVGRPRWPKTRGGRKLYASAYLT